MDKAALLRLLKQSQRTLAADPRAQGRRLHDLQQHQVEFEIQNRELRETQQALPASRDRSADLSDFAPI